MLVKYASVGYAERNKKRCKISDTFFEKGRPALCLPTQIPLTEISERSPLAYVSPPRSGPRNPLAEKSLQMKPGHTIFHCFFFFKKKICPRLRHLTYGNLQNLLIVHTRPHRRNSVHLARCPVEIY